MRVAPILSVGMVLVAMITVGGAALMTRGQPAIEGSVEPSLIGSCPGSEGDLTGETVIVRSSTGQTVTTQLGPPISDVGGAPSAGWPVCYYEFEIQDPIPGDSITFTVHGCSVTFVHTSFEKGGPAIDLSDCATYPPS